jgi:hypothetical protein
MKIDLLTNATVVDDAIRFVSDRSKESQNHFLVRAMKMKEKNQTSLTVVKIKIS